MVESLTDRAAKNDIKKDKNSKNNHNLSMNLKVEKNTIYIQNLIDKSWEKFIDLDSILDTNLDDFICEYEEENEIIISKTIISELEDIKHNLKSA